MYGTIYPVAYFDPPAVLDASITNIPAISSSFLQVIANIGVKAAYAIDYIDTTGQFIGVYYGTPGNESLATVIGGGLNSRAWCVIPARSRVALRSMEATAITSGNLCCIFMGL